MAKGGRRPARSGWRQRSSLQWSAAQRFFPRANHSRVPLAKLEPGQHGVSSGELRIASRRERLRIEAWRFNSGMLALLWREQAPGRYGERWVQLGFALPVELDARQLALWDE